MDIALTWDLAIGVFSAIVIAYSFLVGKNQCVKVIVSTYISLVAVQGIVTLLARLDPEQTLLSSAGLRVEDDIFAGGKLLFFVIIMVLLSMRGGFTVEYEKEDWSPLNVIATGAFGASTAALVIVTLLTYIAGVPLLSAELATSPVIMPLLAQSAVLQYLVQWQDVCFALPAMLLLVVGFYDQTP